MNNILLFEPRQEEVPHLVFMLKLADIECTVAKTAEEALNWISACQLSVARFDLILLNFLQGSGLENMLLSELCKLAKRPVIYVDRQTEEIPSFVKNHVVCQPEGLLACLQEQFNPTYAKDKDHARSYH